MLLLLPSPCMHSRPWHMSQATCTPRPSSSSNSQQQSTCLRNRRRLRRPLLLLCRSAARELPTASSLHQGAENDFCMPSAVAGQRAAACARVLRVLLLFHAAIPALGQLRALLPRPLPHSCDMPRT